MVGAQCNGEMRFVEIFEVVVEHKSATKLIFQIVQTET